MNNKNIFMTPDFDAYNQIYKIIKREEARVFKKNALQQLQAIPKATPIYIYDKGYKNKNQIIPINNHINKTGVNPIREEHTSEILFYDITNIYQKNIKGKIAECFGNKQPTQQKNKDYIQGRFLCNYTILAHYAGLSQIYAFIVD